LKIYVPESDSEFFLDLIGKTDQPICTSVITEIEIDCALNRKERAGDIQHADATKALKRFRKDCVDGRITRLPCNDEAVNRARELIVLARPNQNPVMIRSLDAIHLATAASIRATALVTTDVRMREVAAMLNLKLIPAKIA
jgi:predicted nucleic acid-binding protein